MAAIEKELYSSVPEPVESQSDSFYGMDQTELIAAVYEPETGTVREYKIWPGLTANVPHDDPLPVITGMELRTGEALRATGPQGILRVIGVTLDKDDYWTPANFVFAHRQTEHEEIKNQKEETTGYRVINDRLGLVVPRPKIIEELG